ncbi:tRNA (adenosine(37)-N6)-threonylcarbamoyltransferase complex ATPase subunit type 1 TsaE [Mangrovibacillus cuniculi]|uniref:tRNA threonylcarbamoyladenosine biosynthesis protein TsaE n=1 Tax=Mangrovibacillus cuniculi TaxID=2593652 RepID=A0A7S8HH79_9BACI|nr:tRNA (adenosine(37)-N6)-threonylcarbamoyltransferase complex ATPase subunit type 1 TsaE [Mangrovibacillus cuniculi]QPC48200.1 tRNA (adenosine(37)-N6)-threonylcarbamoyltransferase complex ATPase subunit type 1 TsaE [Mangrovibacillus cuniculi]
MKEWTTTTPEETTQLAQDIATHLSPGTVLLLEGDLGAGKTTFTKGVAKALNIKRTVSSPTFTIIKEYKGTMPLYHMDVYRLGESEEDLGFEEYFYGEGVTLVEWAHLIQDQLPEQYGVLRIERIGDEVRKITYTPVGDKYEKLEKVLEESL